ncbi:MAG: beta-propeller fold lactonase family protein [Thermodesulfobacteriota bacterium]
MAWPNKKVSSVIRRSRGTIVLAVLAPLLLGFGPGSPFFHVETHKDGVKGVDGLRGIWCVTVSPDGKHVYAAGFREHRLAVFDRDEASGRLAFVEALRDDAGGVDGLGGVCSLAVSPEGRHVYAAGHYENALAVFGRDPGDGRLTFIEAQREGERGVEGLNLVQAVTISPEGKNVYAVGYRSYGMAVFRREETTGRLIFLEVHRDGVAGVDGLQGASDVKVSPDGGDVYATGYLDGALAVFRRDRDTGRLTFLEVLRSGLEGVRGLRGAASLILSPEGRHLYVAGKVDNALVAFRRDAETGKLAFLGMEEESLDGSQGLQAPNSVVVNPDGTYVYVAAFGDNAVSVFRREAGTGKLTLAEVLWEDEARPLGIQGPTSVAISPDGKHLYVAGNGVQSLAVFRISPSAP